MSATSPPRPVNYLVCASQRSGSTLLVESLGATRVAGRPEEFFQFFPATSRAPQPREWFAGVTDPSVLDLLAPVEPGEVDIRDAETWRADVLEAGRTENGVWGGKLMWNQTPLLIARSRIGAGSLREAIRWLFDGDPLFVHVHREDVVPQAVSMWRAVQTRVWRDGGAEESGAQDDGAQEDGAQEDGAQYHAVGIAHLAGILREQERQWRKWFAAEGIEPLDIEFRELVDDPTKATARVLEKIGQDPALAPPPPLKPQSNSRSKEWARRYRDDAERNGYPL